MNNYKYLAKILLDIKRVVRSRVEKNFKTLDAKLYIPESDYNYLLSLGIKIDYSSPITIVISDNITEIKMK